jgi:DNA topoisomerase-3
MIVNRQREIDSFDKKAYWTLTLKASTIMGEMFACSWIGLDSDIEGLGQKQHEIGKLEKEVLAQQVVARLQESPEGEVFLKINERKATPPPLLFSITTLQQEANRIFGFTMDETLDIAQCLYEKHKATTYPRTESNHLEEEQAQTVPGVLESIKQMGVVDFDPAECVVQESNKRVFDKTKLTDHFAIIPTGNMQNGMVKGKEFQLYTLICQRSISAFFPSYQYDSSQILLKFDKDIYQATGITPVEQGWRSIYGSTCDADEGEKEDIVKLPDVEDGDLVFADEVDINKKLTKPPRPYTDRTLSKDMSNAKKFVDDPDMAAILKETAGLGQPATRAEIIKTLEKRKYITRKGRSILPTDKAFTLINATREEQVSKPALSALWEQQMAEMVKGRSSDNSEFLEGVGEYISELVKKISQMKINLPETHDSQNQVIARCPECGKDVVEREKSFSCTGYPQCKFAMWKDCMKFAGKPSITTGQAQKLLAGKIVHFKGLVSKKTQKKYEADVVFKKSEKYGWRPSLIFGEKK